VLSVFASDDPAAPPLLGAYERDGEVVVFTPRFPPAPGLNLRAVYRPPIGEVVTAAFAGVPEPVRAPTTQVLSVTPSAAVWPENVLRFYVTFSAPMRIGVAWEHIRLLDAAGQAMGGMFVEVDQELWDPLGQRLTVLFDPARIKRGLVDNINEGPPLAAGSLCELEIEAYWRDAEGGLLVEAFGKVIEVGPPLRAALDPATWSLTQPSAPEDPLVVDVPHPLDAALARRSFAVRLGEAEIVCDVELERDETRLVFRPDQPWEKGRYTLIADAVLEDVAGNRIGRPFDIDRSDPAQADAAAEGAELAFEV
jgi:hypothetical protein